MKKSKTKAASRAVKKPPARSPAAKRKPAAAKPERYHFQLYVTGTTIRSTQAVASIRALCEQHLPGRYELEVIDMYQQPEQAALGQIIAAPTLVKTFPAPLMRMVGNLANRDQVLVKLNLADGLPPEIVP
jgi:circadian clock protein KaiB